MRDDVQVWCDRLESEGVDPASIVSALLVKHGLRIESVSIEHPTEQVGNWPGRVHHIRTGESIATGSLVAMGEEAIAFLAGLAALSYEWQSVPDDTPRH